MDDRVSVIMRREVAEKFLEAMRRNQQGGVNSPWFNECADNLEAALADTGTPTDEMIAEQAEIDFLDNGDDGGFSRGAKWARDYRAPMPTRDEVAAVLCCGHGCADAIMALFGYVSPTESA